LSKENSESLSLFVLLLLANENTDESIVPNKFGESQGKI
jgi:hypothetical protein